MPGHTAVCAAADLLLIYLQQGELAVGGIGRAYDIKAKIMQRIAARPPQGLPCIDLFFEAIMRTRFLAKDAIVIIA